MPSKGPPLDKYATAFIAHPRMDRDMNGETTDRKEFKANQHLLFWKSMFEFIQIHVGNTDDETAGCLLYGLSAAVNDGELRVNSSKLAYQKLYPMVIGAAERGELEIDYIDSDK